MISTEATMCERPLYIFAKPPCDVARAIDRVRRGHGIDPRYAAGRFHITLARLGDSDRIAPAAITRIDQAVAALLIEPFPATFSIIRRNALIAAKGLKGLAAARRGLARQLGTIGAELLPNVTVPHVSLAYNAPLHPDITIVPITWRVEELLLVVSHHGEGRHEVLRRWSLTPRQFLLPFAA